MSPRRADKRSEVRSYAIGYIAALALTAVSFGAVYWHVFRPTTALALVIGLGLVQMLVHFRYFLHISLRRSARDDLLLILFSSLIIVLMVSGTIVIMANLRHRMM